MTQQQPSDQPSATKAAHPQSSSEQSFVPWLTPGSALLISSFPLGLGGYIGYRRALHSSTPPSVGASSTSSSLSRSVFGGKGNSILGQIIHPETPISSSQSAANSIPSTNNPSRVIVSATPPAILASRALVLGSLLSITGTSLLVSAIFFASDCNSMEELVSTWRSFGPKIIHGFEKSLENTFGISGVGKERRLAKSQYEQATKGMTEEEELEYVTKQVGGEIQWGDE